MSNQHLTGENSVNKLNSDKRRQGMEQWVQISSVTTGAR